MLGDTSWGQNSLKDGGHSHAGAPETPRDAVSSFFMMSWGGWRATPITSRVQSAGPPRSGRHPSLRGKGAGYLAPWPPLRPAWLKLPRSGPRGGDTRRSSHRQCQLCFPQPRHGAGSRLGAPAGRRCRDFRRGENKLVAGRGGPCVSEGRVGPVGSSPAPGSGLAFPAMPRATAPTCCPVCSPSSVTCLLTYARCRSRDSRNRLLAVPGSAGQAGLSAENSTSRSVLANRSNGRSTAPNRPERVRDLEQ